MALTPKENMRHVIHHKQPEWAPNGMESVVMLYPPYVERPLREGHDSFVVRYELEEYVDGGTYPAPGGHTIPDVDSMDWSKVTVGWSGAPIPLDEIDREAHLVCGIVEFGLFERSYLLLGMEEALISYMTAPDLMEEMVSALADFKVSVIARFHEVAGLEIIWYGDDWGTQSDLFLPPNVWRRIVKPHTQRIYACTKERGILINQHSCGRIESIFGDVVEMGADVWNPCQPCNDLAALKRQ
jgi:hypothetical protein